MEVNGGAEVHCRLLTEHLLEEYDGDVLTYKSKGIMPWDNNYINDREKISGVNVLRFQVKDASLFPMDSSEYAGPYCPALIDYIKKRHGEYKAVVFLIYGYYPTNVGMKLVIDNAIFGLQLMIIIAL